MTPEELGLDANAWVDLCEARWLNQRGLGGKHIWHRTLMRYCDYDDADHVRVYQITQLVDEAIKDVEL